MKNRPTQVLASVATLTTLLSVSQVALAQKPEDQLVAVVKAYLSMGQPADWPELDKLAGIKWAPLPPAMLQNCLPDGGCFARQGVASIGGRNMAIIATGARTMVGTLYFRNASTPIGEAEVGSALKQAALSPEIARCPVPGGRGTTNWYRLKSANVTAGYLSIQAATAARPQEGFVLTHGDQLPRLLPNQLALYSEQCAAGAVRNPVTTAKPHEQLAAVLLSLLAQDSGQPLYDWQALRSLPTQITWNGDAPKATDPSSPSSFSQSGNVTYAYRQFSVSASGTPTQVKMISFDEIGMHPRGEHMLGVLYEKGITVKLLRCGPVYTESTNNWYSLTSANTRPAMVLQSIRYEGNQAQDAYVLRIDGSLPPRDARDRNPGTNGC